MEIINTQNPIKVFVKEMNKWAR